MVAEPTPSRTRARSPSRLTRARKLLRASLRGESIDRAVKASSARLNRRPRSTPWKRAASFCEQPDTTHLVDLFGCLNTLAAFVAAVLMLTPGPLGDYYAVSYTHLTLPTILLV